MPECAGRPDRPFTPSEILDKVRKITSPVFPRLADICQDLSEFDGDTLDMTWTKVVDRMTAGSNS